MNTQLNDIDLLVESGVYKSEIEAVETAMLALHEKEILQKIEQGREEVKQGLVTPLNDSFVDTIMGRVEARLALKK